MPAILYAQPGVGTRWPDPRPPSKVSKETAYPEPGTVRYPVKGSSTKKNLAPESR